MSHFDECVIQVTRGQLQKLRKERANFQKCMDDSPEDREILRVMVIGIELAELMAEAVEQHGAGSPEHSAVVDQAEKHHVVMCKAFEKYEKGCAE